MKYHETYGNEDMAHMSPEDLELARSLSDAGFEPEKYLTENRLFNMDFEMSITARPSDELFYLR